MRGPETKIMLEREHFDETRSVEEAITCSVADVLQNFIIEFFRQQLDGECRSIRGVSLLNFQGGIFVLDMRLLPEDEVKNDELHALVSKHVEELSKTGEIQR